jgi:predicted dehydrogenase
MVGVGQRGLQHLDCLYRIAGAQVVALCDPFEDNLAEAKIRRFVPAYQAATTRRYTDFNAMMQEGGLDALYLCIPPNVHAGEVIRAAAAGLHLFVEKPVSLFLDEALAMDRAIASAGTIATVGFNQRHDNWHTAMRDFLAGRRLVQTSIINNGTLESHSVKHTRTEAAGGPRNRVWAANYAWSGSTVVEAGIHQVDLMRYWAGDINWVEARYQHRDDDDIVDGGDNPYGYSVTFGFACGMIANLVMTRLRRTFWGDGYMDIAWDHGHLKLEGSGPVAYYYDGPYPPAGPVGSDAVRHPLPVPPRNDNTLEINRDFIAAAATGDGATLRNTFHSSLNSHAAVLGANVSDRLGGQRVVLAELLSAETYAAFRRKENG